MLNRRALLMAGEDLPDPPLDAWDIDWKYTDGPLEDLGFTKKLDSGATVEMTTRGLKMSIKQSSAYYYCPVKINKHTIFEIDLVVDLMGSSWRNKGFFAMISSSGSFRNGCQVYIKQDRIYYDGKHSGAANGQALGPLSAGEPYTLRLEHYQGVLNRVSLNGRLLYEGNLFGSTYIFSNEFGLEDWDSRCEVTITGVRYSFLEE